MRVSIEHEQRLYGKRPDVPYLYLIKVIVQLSETEKAIVTARALRHHTIDVSPGVLSWVMLEPEPDDVKGRAALFLIIGIFFPPLLFVAAYLWIKSFSVKAKFDTDPCIIPVATFFNTTPVSIATFSPVQAKEVDDRIRNVLAGLKASIDQSEKLVQKDTFEL